MPYVTTLTLTSGDSDRLDTVVEDIKDRAERKGVELKGPHPKPPKQLRVAQSKTLGPDGGQFDPWNYTVYTRTIEIIGYESFARDVAAESFPPGIHVEVGVTQRSQVGSGS
jgi:ribosomal protein S10